MERYQLENCSNARIFIDYNKEEKVRFEYPNKKTNIQVCETTLKSMLPLLLKPALLLTMGLLGFGVLIELNTASVSTNMQMPNFLILFSVIPILVVALIWSSIKPLSHLLAKSNWFVKNIPNINKKLLKDYCYKKVEELQAPFFEITYFENIFLDYKATKDFGKYLERIEITEHDFEVCRKTKKGKLIKEQNDEIWRAKFYFKEIPKEGFLEIEYA